MGFFTTLLGPITRWVLPNIGRALSNFIVPTLARIGYGAKSLLFTILSESAADVTETLQQKTIPNLLKPLQDKWAGEAAEATRNMLLKRQAVVDLNDTISKRTPREVLTPNPMGNPYLPESTSGYTGGPPKDYEEPTGTLA